MTRETRLTDRPDPGPFGALCGPVLDARRLTPSCGRPGGVPRLDSVPLRTMGPVNAGRLNQVLPKWVSERARAFPAQARGGTVGTSSGTVSPRSDSRHVRWDTAPTRLDPPGVAWPPPWLMGKNTTDSPGQVPTKWAGHLSLRVNPPGPVALYGDKTLMQRGSTKVQMASGTATNRPR